MEVSIIVPTLNEVSNIAELIRRIEAACRGIDAELVFVDDSTDSTPEEIRRCGLRTALPVHLVHRDRPVGGLSGAVVEGMARSTASYCLVMHADLQHPPELIPELLAPLARGESDLVVASRYAGRGSGTDDPAFRYRRIVSTCLTSATRTLFPVRLRGCTDPLAGFFAVRRSSVDPALLHPSGFKILLEIVLRHGVRVTEVPFAPGERTQGESKATLPQGLRLMRQLGELRIGRVGLFAVVGGIGTVLNLLIMGALVLLGLHYVIAALVAAELTILSNFALQEKLVFAGDRRSASALRTRFLQSVGFNNVEALLRMPVLMLLVEMIGMHSVLAQAGTLAAAFVVRYLFHARIVYGSKGTPVGASSPVDAVATAPAAADETCGPGGPERFGVDPSEPSRAVQPVGRRTAMTR